MKKCLVFFLVLSVGFAFADSITTTFDLGFTQDLIIRSKSYQFSTDVRYCFNDKYEVRLPVTMSFAQQAQLYDVGIFLDYYPWKNQGLFFGLSLVQFGLINGETSLEKNLFSLNEVNLGWTFNLVKGLVIEPSLSIRDPSGTYGDEYELIKGVFPCNRDFRFRISAGWRFNLGK